MVVQDKVIGGLAQFSKSSADCGEFFLQELCSVRGKDAVEALEVGDMVFMSHAFQATVLELARMAEKSKCSVMTMVDGHGELMVSSFIDSVMEMACNNSPPVDLSLPAMCLEILMEVTTTTNCIDIFDYLDSRMEMFTRPGVRQKSQYTLLRTCNILLKRLSKSQDAELCGRVLIFLAKFLPLTERSGVNMYGNFHVDNETPIEDVKDGDGDAEGRSVDVKFYKTFWGLQKWFADPTSALAPGSWDLIMESMNIVLKKFASIKVTVTEDAGSLRKSGDHGASAKYLSSAGLLPLQIRDATFRRTVLVQFLILIGWLENPLLKDWISKIPSERILSSIQHIKQKIFAQLRRTPENGVAFADAVTKVLKGEMAWNLWKQGGCPAEAFQLSTECSLEGLVEGSICPPLRKRKRSEEATHGVELGVPELTRLWNLTEDNLSMLSADDRGGFTDLRQLMEPVIDEIKEPEEDDTFCISQDQVYNWKTLRVVARESLPAFAAAVREGGDLKVAARLLYPKEVPVEDECTNYCHEKTENDTHQQPG
jgi:THO complex subunit 1